ncbi:MAG: M56 family metallopeptidase [Steroidobacteraceae bacterium]
MERESLLSLLIIVLGGVTLHLCAAWPRMNPYAPASQRAEQLHWLALWWPAAPTSIVAAWLCGWALSEPDPVLDPIGSILFIACVPFGIVLARAVLRAIWSLARSPEHCGVATVGILRPHIVFPPQLAKRLDARAIEAALAHERAHIQHRDPLRLWAAQFVTDLQWPWGSAQHRFTSWLEVLELARDDEARAAGVDGADLAAALVGSLRFQSAQRFIGGVGLIGRPEVVQVRVARLLRPLTETSPHRGASPAAIAVILILTLVLALLLGVAFGERVIAPLLALSA